MDANSVMGEWVNKDMNHVKNIKNNAVTETSSSDLMLAKIQLRAEPKFLVVWKDRKLVDFLFFLYSNTVKSATG